MPPEINTQGCGFAEFSAVSQVPTYNIYEYELIFVRH